MQTAAPVSTIPTYPIGKVVAQWLADIEPNTLRKTLTIKAAAVEGFAKHYGEKSPLHEAGWLDVGRWVEALRASGFQTPTIANKTGYLRGVFDWAKARGLYPSFAKDDNPAAGQVVFRTKEKRARRVLGLKAFSVDQIRILLTRRTRRSVRSRSMGCMDWSLHRGACGGSRAAGVGWRRGCRRR